MKRRNILASQNLDLFRRHVMWQAKSYSTPHQHHARSSPITVRHQVWLIPQQTSFIICDVETRHPICQRMQDISVHSVSDLDELESVNPYVILRLPVNQGTEMKVRTGYILSHYLNTFHLLTTHVSVCKRI